MRKIIVIGIALAAIVGFADFKSDEPIPVGGLTIPCAGHLCATAGVVDLKFVLPQEWPNEGDQTLFHVGDQAHKHVTLFCRNGSLIAVYKADNDSHVSINHVVAREWEPGGTHRVQFQWQQQGDEVPFYLRVDGDLVSIAKGRAFNKWPVNFHLGARGKLSPWQGRIVYASVRPESPPLPEFLPGSREITVDTARKIGTIYNFWSISNYTRQDLFTNAAYRVQQKINHPFMRYVNCVRLLGGRHDGRNKWFKGLDENGNPIFDFVDMIAILQGILDAGYTPRIVLDNVPLEMSADVEMEKYGNVHPPQDYALWELYVEKALQAMVDAFGYERVASWRFRVGTEPDLHPGHWIGTEREYQHHYARTTAAVLRVIAQPDIGPGNILDTKLGKWGLNLVDFIATNNLPMTFFSSSWYGRVGEKQQGFEYNARTIRKKLEQYERLKTIPFEVAEFAILNDEFNRRLWNGDNTEWGASWYAGIAEKVYRLNVGQVHQWATTVFGIVQPRSHVHTMLGKMMGGDRLDVSVTEVNSSALSGAIAALRGDVIFVLIYNHHPLREPKLTENIRLNIYDSRMKQGEEWRLNEWLVDRDHGVFIYDFVKDCEAAELVPLPEGIKLSGDIQRCWGPAGVNILRRNFKRYAELARLAQTGANDKIKVEDGRTTMNITMKGHSVRLLQLSR